MRSAHDTFVSGGPITHVEFLRGWDGFVTQHRQMHRDDLSQGRVWMSHIPSQHWDGSATHPEASTAVGTGRFGQECTWGSPQSSDSWQHVPDVPPCNIHVAL